MSDLYTSSRIALDIGACAVDPYDQTTIDPNYELRTLPEELGSLKRALLATRDEVDIPATKLGFIQLRSTWARLGLVSPPTVADPGFFGHLTLEVFNASGSTILVPDGEAIWSMHLVDADEPFYRGRYQGQQGITLPRALSRPSYWLGK